MSVWHEIKKQEDVEVSEDGKTIDVLFSSDNWGNNYIQIPIKFIELRCTVCDCTLTDPICYDCGGE